MLQVIYRVRAQEIDGTGAGWLQVVEAAHAVGLRTTSEWAAAPLIKGRTLYVLYLLYLYLYLCTLLTLFTLVKYKGK